MQINSKKKNDKKKNIAGVKYFNIKSVHPKDIAKIIDEEG